MKTELKNKGRSRTTKLVSPRLRPATARLPRQPRGSPTLTFVNDAAIRAAAENVTKDKDPVRAESAPGDMLQLYLREIGEVKLLTPDEEIALAKRIRKGDKKAREEMIKANLRLVVKIARDYEGF